jgi:hypothetical protein
VTRIAILQSNYIPWRGYFDILNLVDQFLIYDIVQYTKDDWRNRNRIKTAQGPQWLTIPVATSGKFGQTIAETRIADRTWAAKHWKSISQAYARAPFFEMYRDRFADAYRRAADIERLSLVNREFMGVIADALGITTPVVDAAPYVTAVDRSERLVELCQAMGAGAYLSGPSARDYLDPKPFADAGIRIDFMDYSGYEPYPQLHGPFEPAVSVIDLLFNMGPGASAHLSQKPGP